MSLAPASGQRVPRALSGGGRDTHDGHENSPILVFFSNLLGPLPPDEVERMQRIGDHIYGRHKPKFKEAGDLTASSHLRDAG